MSTVTQLENISKYILSKPLLKSIFVPASRVFISLAGHRKMGLRTEDLISEESEVMQTAIRRLPAKDTYERVFRFATAVQLSLSHHLLPKDQWLKPEDDKGSLIPYILEAEAQAAERKELDNIIVKKK